MKSCIKEKTHNTKGFSLIEALIGILVMTIVVLVITSTQAFIGKKMSQLSHRLDDNSDSIIGERFILRDLQTAHVSFGNIKNNNFFDFIPDLPTSYLGMAGKRVFNMNCQKICGEFIFITEDISKGPLIIFDPSSLYEVGPQGNLNVSSNLTFKGVNKNGWLKVARPDFWKRGSMLLLDTATKLRPTNQNGNIDLKTLPRSSIFAGYVVSDFAINLTPNLNISSFFNTTHPITGAEINTANEFLRSVEGLGGGMPIVRARAIKIIKYYLTKKESPLGANLFRAEFDPIKNDFLNSQLLANHIDSVDFIRPSITTKLVQFKINKIVEK